jgi:hypothetical protein
MSRKTPDQVRQIIIADEIKKNTNVTPSRQTITNFMVDMYAVIEKHVPALKEMTKEIQTDKEALSPKFRMYGIEKETIARTIISCATVSGAFALTNEDGVDDRAATAMMLTSQLAVLVKTVANNDPQKLGEIISGIAGMAKRAEEQEEKQPDIH